MEQTLEHWNTGDWRFRKLRKYLAITLITIISLQHISVSSSVVYQPEGLNLVKLKTLIYGPFGKTC